MKKFALIFGLTMLLGTGISCHKKSTGQSEPTPREILTAHDWRYDNLTVSNGSSSSDTPQNIRFVFSTRHYYTHDSSGNILEHGDYTIDDAARHISLIKSSGSTVDYDIKTFNKNEMVWELQNGNFTYTLHFSAL